MSDFTAKIHQIVSAGGLPQTTLGELTVRPQTLELDFRGLF